MQERYRLHRRANGVCYIHDRETGGRESLHTKDEREARKLIQAKNDALAQPALNRELAKVYLHAQDADFCERTWSDVAALIDSTYAGATKDRFAKFVKSKPFEALTNRKLVDTTSVHFLEVLGHPKAGVSTNVQLRFCTIAPLIWDGC